MPNWCEGFLKVRGDMQSIKRFLIEGLQAYDLMGETRIADGVSIAFEDEFLIEIMINRVCHISGTKRAFAEDGEVYIEDRQGKDSIVTIKIKQAWDMSAAEFAEISSKYGVDLRLFGYERGCQFSRDIIIENGRTAKDETKQYDDWDWECPCSELGG